tara:strand:+ start:13934 stop:14134 length:201 start_codon:yes stop_codon:yes gene_type:complete
MNTEAEIVSNLVGVKWALFSIAVSLWGLSFYFLLKEIPVWWHSFDKKEETVAPTRGDTIKQKKNGK